MSPHIPEGVHLVPGHPVAGTEHSGPEAGFAELFQDRFSILTPPRDADQQAVAQLRAFWQAIGSDVEVMDAEHHDRVLATTSHLPHLIAYTIVATAADLESELEAKKAEDDDIVTTREVIKYSAGGFRDFTRIAASDPVMWRDIFLLNKDAVLEMLGRFTEDLTALQRAIRHDDGETLFAMFTRTRDIRRGVIEARQAGRFQYTENDEKD
jgi:cyclohexadieny/prephenate dehydrogenase